MKSLKRFWDRSLPRPVGETGRRSVGNGKARLRDYAGFPDRQPSVPPTAQLYIVSCISGAVNASEPFKSTG